MSDLVWTRMQLKLTTKEMDAVRRDLKINSKTISYRGEVFGYEPKEIDDPTRSWKTVIDVIFFAGDRQELNAMFQRIVEDHPDTAISAGYIDFNTPYAGGAEFAAGKDVDEHENESWEDYEWILDWALRKRSTESEANFQARKADLLERIASRHGLSPLEVEERSGGVSPAVWWLAGIAAIGGVSYYVNRNKPQ